MHRNEAVLKHVCVYVMLEFACVYVCLALTIKRFIVSFEMKLKKKTKSLRPTTPITHWSGAERVDDEKITMLISIVGAKIEIEKSGDKNI